MDTVGGLYFGSFLRVTSMDYNALGTTRPSPTRHGKSWQNHAPLMMVGVTWGNYPKIALPQDPCSPKMCRSFVSIQEMPHGWGLCFFKVAATSMFGKLSRKIAEVILLFMMLVYSFFFNLLVSFLGARCPWGRSIWPWWMWEYVWRFSHGLYRKSKNIIFHQCVSHIYSWTLQLSILAGDSCSQNRTQPSSISAICWARFNVLRCCCKAEHESPAKHFSWLRF